MAYGLGTACTAYDSLVLLEAFVLTAAVAGSLTAYTFWAAKRYASWDVITIV
jgi:FtsH-binding integral membrane protein